jgi:hypothetical protein
MTGTTMLHHVAFLAKGNVANLAGVGSKFLVDGGNMLSKFRTAGKRACATVKLTSEWSSMFVNTHDMLR